VSFWPCKGGASLSGGLVFTTVLGTMYGEVPSVVIPSRIFPPPLQPTSYRVHTPTFDGGVWVKFPPGWVVLCLSVRWRE